ncbi:hypothetical protein ACFVHQ_17760 [Actinomycetes bacterium NPDC127524]
MSTTKIPLVINKYDADGNEHPYKIINNEEDIKEVKKVLKNTKWENSKVEFKKSPDYNFYFDNPNAKTIEYRLWITPNKKQIEIYKGTAEFARLSVKDSASIFSIFEIRSN